MTFSRVNVSHPVLSKAAPTRTRWTHSARAAQGGSTLRWATNSTRVNAELSRVCESPLQPGWELRSFGSLHVQGRLQGSRSTVEAPVHAPSRPRVPRLKLQFTLRAGHAFHYRGKIGVDFRETATSSAHGPTLSSTLQHALELHAPRPGSTSGTRAPGHALKANTTPHVATLHSQRSPLFQPTRLILSTQPGAPPHPNRDLEKSTPCDPGERRRPPRPWRSPRLARNVGRR